jgi:hypothetical protein
VKERVRVRKRGIYIYIYMGGLFYTNKHVFFIDFENDDKKILVLKLCCQYLENCLWDVAAAANRLDAYQSHSLTYCREMVQKYDYEGYLCILYIPRWAHATQYALRAFNIEISRIQEQTRQLITAQMRMQFWKDTLDAIYQEVRSMG